MTTDKIEPIDMFLTRQTPRPTRFYWAEPNRLCGMAFPTQKQQYNWLYEHCGVRLVVNLMEESWQPDTTYIHWYVDVEDDGVSKATLLNDEIVGESTTLEAALVSLPQGLQCLHFPIRDAGIPKSLQQFDALIQKIHAYPHPVAVHCWMGLGRTGLVTAAYRIRYHNEKADSAITHVKRQQIGALPCPDQWDFLRRYDVTVRSVNPTLTKRLTAHVRCRVTQQQIGDDEKGHGRKDETT